MRKHPKLKLFLTLSLLLFSGALLIKYQSRQEITTDADEKPNIIFLLTDDQRWDALGAMGNNIIQTPHLDQLAGNGILFQNAYVTTSICAVSRASILSGQYQSRHKINNFSTSFTPEALEQTYPLLMRNAGYTTAFIGKYGVGKPEDQPKEQYDFWACSEKGQPDYELRDENDDYLHHTDKVGNDIENFLKQHGNNGPFCMSVSFKAPHVQDRDPRQFIIHPRYKPYYSDVKIPVPETADPQYWNSFPDFFRTEENIARERWHLRFATPEMYQESVKNYYRLITGVDDVVGRMVNKLEEMELADNTVIIFMGDNGFYLGEHGLAGKWYGHEESIRVPLIVYDPRQAEKLKGAKPEQIALNIDIAPTILSLAGIEAPQTMQGEDLMRIAGDVIPEREDFFYEHTFMGSPGIPKVEGVVRKDLKYMKFNEHDYEELYDLKQDPREKQNLAGNPAYQDKLIKMRRRYDELKEKVK
jgi:arylsulfatase A-like enzyme